MARALAELLGVPHVELDALAWGPAWSEVPRDVLRARVEEATAADAWIVDGNYGGAGVRDIVWERADTVVWLDYPLWLILGRLTRRNIERIRSGRELWPGTGNRETIRNSFFSRESLYVWALRTHRRRRRQYREILARPEHAHLDVHRFTRPADAARWLSAQGPSHTRRAPRGTRPRSRG
jgi:adenylate kinase family enzyme